LVKITARPETVDRLKAFVTVMEGCEKHCTFCVVPTTRGRERSHAPDTIVEEIRGLAAAGCKEVTLLGQTVNAYGRDLMPPTDLAALLEQVNDIEGVERIRFTTSNPYNLTSRLIRAIRDVPKVVEHLHLPLQSGSDRVLERMNRGYTRARYLEQIAEIRETVPAIALSTDLIVGFPGETDEDFAETVHMVEAVGYDNVFVFRYSRRPGTAAAVMQDQVPDDVKASRNSTLLEVAGRVATGRSRRLEGLEMKVKQLALDPLSNMPMIILRDEEEKRSLPIWVGLPEANAIALELEKISTARPMTHDLIRNILEAVGARVAKVVVNDLKENTFYAVIHLRLGSTDLTVDSRPSDAIALALRVDAPIYGEEEALTKAESIEGKVGKEPEGRGTSDDRARIA